MLENKLSALGHLRSVENVSVEVTPSLQEEDQPAQEEPTGEEPIGGEPTEEQPENAELNPSRAELRMTLCIPEIPGSEVEKHLLSKESVSDITDDILDALCMKVAKNIFSLVPHDGLPDKAFFGFQDHPKSKAYVIYPGEHLKKHAPGTEIRVVIPIEVSLHRVN